ncbi:MAG TPA: response regulator, partial [Dongiaceae bacterium]|nr:response regulator [Dongiaceae bacterium]
MTATAMQPKILIIEDEKALADVLDDYLRHHQFSTRIEANGAQALETFANFHPDLILLDLMLPGVDGLTICREIRTRSTVPIIMTTARVEEIDRLLGLELGADDYICKPYSPREVIARVKAVLRRARAAETAESSKALVLRPESMSASLLGVALDLTAVEYRLLETMAMEPRRIFTRDQLMDRIYTDQRIVSDRTIDSHI